MEPENISPENGEKVLTGIHDMYTLSATHEGNANDELMVKIFLNTLAEVALSVAQRKQRMKSD